MLSSLQRYRVLWLVFGLTVWLMVGCATQSDQQADASKLPAHFQGKLPCHSCAGIDYDLLLSSGHAYILTQDYDAENPVSEFETGQWQFDEDQQILKLTPANTDAGMTTRWLADEDHEHLKALNEKNRPIAANDSRYELTRAQSPDSHDLTGPRWLWSENGGGASTAGSDPAYIELEDSANRLTGFTGCNQVMAHFVHSDKALQIGQVSMTRKVCPEAPSNAEQELQETLQHTRRYDTLGDYLLLYGGKEDPSPLAVFRTDSR